MGGAWSPGTSPAPDIRVRHDDGRRWVISGGEYDPAIFDIDLSARRRREMGENNYNVHPWVLAWNEKKFRSFPWANLFLYFLSSPFWPIMGHPVLTIYVVSILWTLNYILYYSWSNSNNLRVLKVYSYLHNIVFYTFVYKILGVLKSTKSCNYLACKLLSQIREPPVK